MKNFRFLPLLLFTIFLVSCEEETPTFTLLTTASPIEGGKITYSTNLISYNQGQVVTIISEANAGWVFKGWGGDESGTTNPVKVQMNSNKLIFGFFVKLHELTYQIEGKGKIIETIINNPSGRELPEGTTVEITPVPDDGWLFESWSIGFGENYIVSNENPKRITVDMEKTINVRFVPKPQGNPRFYLAENGITCKCENVIAGSKGVISGVEFEAVNNEFLRTRLAEKADMTKLCTSLVTDMSFLFDDQNFNQPIGNWDVINVTNMAGMFADIWGPFGSEPTRVFNQPIGAWDVSNVTDMSGMFAETFFNQPIGNWDVRKVTTMSNMFFASKFDQPIGNWDVSNVRDMSAMFVSTKFNQPITEWNVSKVISMDYMFQDNFAFNQDLSKWCVIKIPQPPKHFLTGGFTLPKPIWGTCPD